MIPQIRQQKFNFANYSGDSINKAQIKITPEGVNNYEKTV